MADTFCTRCYQLISDLLDLDFDRTRWVKRGFEDQRALPGSGVRLSYASWAHQGDWYTAEHSSVEEVCISSTNGCLMCSLIIKEFGLPTENSDEVPLSKYMAPVLIEIQMNPLTAECTFDVFIEDALKPSAKFEMFNIEGPPIIPRIKICQASPENTGSEEAFALVSEWVYNCLNDHPGCVRRADMRLPTRVIDVEPEDGSAPRLVVTAQKRISGQYVALSHCWGDVDDKKRMVTTSKNIDRFCTEGLPLRLPRTFRDAITITKKLGFRYLWIDSFCIIQGSRQDWMKEAPRMALVYENAVVCISALRAKHDFSGMFSNTSTPLDSGFPTMTYMDIAEEPHRIGIRPKSKSFDDNISKDILSTRAWAVQERLLSTAILHYGEGGLAWECRTCLKTDTCSNSSPVVHPTLKGMKLAEDASPNTLVQGGWGLLWCKVINEYTRRHLSEDKDKLVGITGFSSFFGRYLEDTFLAGLWDEDLHRGLLWHRPDYKPEVGLPLLEKPGTGFQIAPSWSWASIKGEVTYDCSGGYSLVYRLPTEHDAEIMSARSVNDEFGAACYGTIEIFGQLSRAYYRPSKGPHVDPGSGYVQFLPPYDDAAEKRKSRVVPAPPSIVPTIPDMFPTREALVARRNEGILALSASMDFDWQRERECYVLRIATWAAVDEEGDLFGEHTHFLILERFSKEDKRAEYKRTSFGPDKDLGPRPGLLPFRRIGHGADGELGAEVFFETSAKQWVILE